jgi:hypothetical protein
MAESISATKASTTARALAWLALVLQALQNQHNVQGQHLEAPDDRVGCAQIAIEALRARLGQNRAIKLTCSAALMGALSEPAEHGLKLPWDERLCTVADRPGARYSGVGGRTAILQGTSA